MIILYSFHLRIFTVAQDYSRPQGKRINKKTAQNDKFCGIYQKVKVYRCAKLNALFGMFIKLLQFFVKLSLLFFTLRRVFGALLCNM